MNTENETWRDASSAKENTGAEHDGNQFNGDYGNLTPYGNSGQDKADKGWNGSGCTACVFRQRCSAAGGIRL